MSPPPGGKKSATVTGRAAQRRKSVSDRFRGGAGGGPPQPKRSLGSSDRAEHRRTPSRGALVRKRSVGNLVQYGRDDDMGELGRAVLDASEMVTGGGSRGGMGGDDVPDLEAAKQILRRSGVRAPGSLGGGGGGSLGGLARGPSPGRHAAPRGGKRGLLDELGTRTDKWNAKMDALASVLSDNKDTDWEKRIKAIKELRQLVDEGAAVIPVFVELLRTRLKIPMELQITDLRSQIIKEACGVMARMAEDVGDAYAELAEYYVPVLLRQSTIKIAIIAESSMACLDAMVRHVRHVKVFKAVLAECADKKNNVLRTHCTQLLVVMLSEWPADRLRKARSKAGDTLVALLSDAVEAVRANARRAFWAYASHFASEAAARHGELDANVRKHLDRAQPDGVRLGGGGDGDGAGGDRRGSTGSVKGKGKGKKKKAGSGGSASSTPRSNSSTPSGTPRSTPRSTSSSGSGSGKKKKAAGSVKKKKKKKPAAVVEAMLASRPSKGTLRARNILHNEASPVGADMVRARQRTLQERLAARASAAELQEKHILVDEHEREVKAAALAKRLVRRPSRGELLQRNVLNPDEVDTESKKAALAKRLVRRPSRGQLLERNVLNPDEVDNDGKAAALAKRLVRRPSRGQLLERNVLHLDGGDGSKQHGEAREKLAGKLARRMSSTDLRSRGVLRDTNELSNRRAERQQKLAAKLAARAAPEELEDKHILVRDEEAERRAHRAKAEKLLSHLQRGRPPRAALARKNILKDDKLKAAAVQFERELDRTPVPVGIKSLDLTKLALGVRAPAVAAAAAAAAAGPEGDVTPRNIGIQWFDELLEDPDVELLEQETLPALTRRAARQLNTVAAGASDEEDEFGDLTMDNHKLVHAFELSSRGTNKVSTLDVPDVLLNSGIPAFTARGARGTRAVADFQAYVEERYEKLTFKVLMHELEQYAIVQRLLRKSKKKLRKSRKKR